MFRLNSPNLPTKAKGGYNSAPLVRVFKSATSVSLAPVARVNIHTNYFPNPNFKGEIISLPTPSELGVYYRKSGLFPITYVSIDGFKTEINSKTNKLGSVWIDDHVINLYSKELINDDITVNVTVVVNLPPITSSNTFVLPLGDGFTCSSVFSSELQILPQIIEQGDRTITIDGTFLKTGATVQVSGSQILSLGEPVCAICTFDLSKVFTGYLDNLDFMGMSFTENANVLFPQIGEFIWNETTSLATIFVSRDRLLGIVPKTPSVSDYLSIPFVL